MWHSRVRVAGTNVEWISQLLPRGKSALGDEVNCLRGQDAVYSPEMPLSLANAQIAALCSSLIVSVRERMIYTEILMEKESERAREQESERARARERERERTREKQRKP